MSHAMSGFQALGRTTSENYIYIIFKILNCKNTCRFENFAKIAPCRQLLGRQVPCRPSTWRQGAICKITGGRGPAANWLGGRPPSPYISPPPPLGGSFETSKIQKKRREVRRSEAAKPCWILDLQSSGN